MFLAPVWTITPQPQKGSLIKRFETTDVLSYSFPETSSASTWTCPQRVFFPLGVGPVTVCDYVFKDETVKVTINCPEIPLVGKRNEMYISQSAIS